MSLCVGIGEWNELARTPPPSSRRHLSWLVRRASRSTEGLAGRRSLYSM